MARKTVYNADNINKCKNVSITYYLESLGYSKCLKKSTAKYSFFLTPFNEEKTPSFCVNESTNTWYCYSSSQGGDVLDLVMFMDDVTFVGAIRKLLGEDLPTKTTVKEEKIKISKIEDISNSFLKSYLIKRGISLETAARYLKQVSYKVNGTGYYGLGFPNMSGGWEIRNEYFKGSVSPKNVSFFLGKKNHDTALVFEGFFDFLSYMEHSGFKEPLYDTYVLNSVGFKERVARPKIIFFGDNDKAGDRTASFYKEHYNVSDQRVVFRDFEDYNEYWVEKQDELRRLAKRSGDID